jgi:hypothetical protein
MNVNIRTRLELKHPAATACKQDEEKPWRTLRVRRIGTKGILGLLLALTLAVSLQAQVEVLPPDFTLFGNMNGDYCAEWLNTPASH